MTKVQGSERTGSVVSNTSCDRKPVITGNLTYTNDSPSATWWCIKNQSWSHCTQEINLSTEKNYFFFLTRFATFSLTSAYFKHLWKAVFAEILSVRLKSSNRLANTAYTANELNVSIVNNLQ